VARVFRTRGETLTRPHLAILNPPTTLLSLSLFPFMASSDSNTISPLLSLPVELLQGIARQCTCTTLLNLMLVNRQLYAACNDRLVFRYIAENGHRTTATSPKWTAAATFLNQASAADTLRIAFAAEKATAIAQDVQGDTPALYGMEHPESSIEKAFYKWLPHLIAMGHPCCTEINPLYFLNSLDLSQNISNFPDGTTGDDFKASRMNIAFCTFVATLALTGKRPVMQIIIDYARFLLWRNPGASEENGQSELTVMKFFKNFALAVPTREGHQPSQGISAILVIMSLLLHAGRTNTYRLPSMDFPSIMNIPPVYRGSSMGFNKCHLSKMCTPQFLSGEWVGYYSDHRYGGVRLDPPMHTIHMETSLESDLEGEGTETIVVDPAVVVDPASEGRDGHGHFNLSGTIRPDGRVTMTKRYSHQRWTWDWLGDVTPFGLAGVWGASPQRGGYFWIWKKEWCEQPT